MIPDPTGIYSGNLRCFNAIVIPLNLILYFCMCVWQRGVLPAYSSPKIPTSMPGHETQIDSKENNSDSLDPTLIELEANGPTLTALSVQRIFTKKSQKEKWALRQVCSIRSPRRLHFKNLIVNGVHPPNTTVNGEPLEPPIPHADLPSREKRAGSYCVLALDGGGYRGYASLLMLKRILPSTGEPPTRRVYPYQYFDLICGTSTGGLIAILLGALHLDIDEAIKLYKKLSKTVFAGRWRWLRWILRDERFSSRVLRETMGDVIERQGCKNMLMIQSDRGKGCKVRILLRETLASEETIYSVSWPLQPNLEETCRSVWSAHIAILRRM